MSALDSVMGRRRRKAAEPAPVLDIDQIKLEPLMEQSHDDEQDAPHGPEAYAQPDVRLPLPEYVQHVEGVTREGRLTSQVIASEFEKAAKEIEAMGEELIANGKRVDEAAEDMIEALKHVVETAAAYREAGKRWFLQIQNHTLLTAEVKAKCQEMREKISFDPAAVTGDKVVDDQQT